MLPIIEGDVFQSNADVILHQVNCKGVMGSGVALQVKQRYPDVFKQYLKLCNEAPTSKTLLGVAQFCEIENGRFICNLFGQDKFGYNGKCYSDYEALKIALHKVNEQCVGKTVAIPYLIACHRGGGDWKKVSKIIEESLFNCDVTFYKYSGG